uniref:SLC41A/MgtE integral membrane domain-containing protein n=1 Tax=Timema genevievae TaxID=629358 RepID=A0A7R9PKM4_TIMGE|nr:unnamed protein product [Timema genevievae]
MGSKQGKIQASVAAIIVAIFAMTVHYLIDGEEDARNALLLMASGIATATSSCFVLDFVLIAVIIVSHRYKMNPDNVATPMAASIGDVVCISLFSQIASQFYLDHADLTSKYILLNLPSLHQFGNCGKFQSSRVRHDVMAEVHGTHHQITLCPYDVADVERQWFFPPDDSKNGWILLTGIIVAYILLLPIWIWIVLKNEYTRPVLKNGWIPVISALMISGMGGIVLDLVVNRFNGFVVFQPIINGIGGNLVSVQASRISTYLHVTKPKQMGFIPPQTRLFASPWRVLVSFLLYIGHILVHFMWKLKIDPDNAVIPYLTSIGDLAGSGILVMGFIFLTRIGNIFCAKTSSKYFDSCYTTKLSTANCNHSQLREGWNADPSGYHGYHGIPPDSSANLACQSHCSVFATSRNPALFPLEGCLYSPPHEQPVSFKHLPLRPHHRPSQSRSPFPQFYLHSISSSLSSVLALSVASAASLSRNLHLVGSLIIPPTKQPCTSCWFGLLISNVRAHSRTTCSGVPTSPHSHNSDSTSPILHKDSGYGPFPVINWTSPGEVSLASHRLCHSLHIEMSASMDVSTSGEIQRPDTQSNAQRVGCHRPVSPGQSQEDISLDAPYSPGRHSVIQPMSPNACRVAHNGEQDRLMI